MTRTLTLIFFCTCLALSGCGSFLASMESNTLEDDPGERTLGQQLDDETIETKAVVNIRAANEAFDEAHLVVVSYNGYVLLAGQEVKAGSYSFWAIPGEEEWTFIINTEADLWHTAYNHEHDLFRFIVMPESSEHFDTLTFTFTDVTAHSANLVFLWDKLAVSIPLALP